MCNAVPCVRLLQPDSAVGASAAVRADRRRFRRRDRVGHLLRTEHHRRGTGDVVSHWMTALKPRV